MGDHSTDFEFPSPRFQKLYISSRLVLSAVRVSKQLMLSAGRAQHKQKSKTNIYHIMYKTVATSFCGMRDAVVIYSHNPENSSDNLADVHDFCHLATSCPQQRSLSPMMICLEIVAFF